MSISKFSLPCIKQIIPPTSFNAEIGDLLSWLSEVDSVIAASKPVGGLPETASEQLERFMVRTLFVV